MRILGLLHRNRVAAVLLLLGTLGFVAGCGDAPPVSPGGGLTADAQAKEDAERAAREKAYGKGGTESANQKTAKSARKQ